MQKGNSIKVVHILAAEQKAGKENYTITSPIWFNNNNFRHNLFVEQ